VGLVSAITLAAAIRWQVPWGGVPLGNISLTQAGGPFLSTARVAGALTVVTVVAIGAVIILGLAARRWVDVTTATVVGVVLLLLAGFAPSGAVDATVRIAAVQGGGELGTRARDSSSREVFERHVAATGLIDEPVDLVLWPEDVVTVNAPFAASQEYDEIRALSEAVGAQIVVGLIERESDRFRNAAVVMGPEGEVARYEKVIRVPFGEFIPFRGLVETVVSEVESLVPRDAVPGEGPAVVETDLGPFATVISFELFFPRRVADGVGNGGVAVLGPTNGSSYPDTRVPEQTLASSRLRAVETGRWLVQAAPTGYTAVVNSDGDVVERTGLREQRVVIADVELRTGQTWAVRFGSTPLVVVAVLGLIVALWAGPRRRETAERRSNKAALLATERQLGIHR
jgi:apolipoprotein N-acyltransferase